MSKRKKITYTVYRSSRTGHFVTEKFAKKHPATTQKQIISYWLKK